MILSLHKKQTGFTLSELIVAVSITSLLLIGIMTFLISSLADNSVKEAKADLLREAQLTLDALVKDARLSAGVDEANTITDSNSPNAEATYGRGWESNASTLILTRSAEDSNRNILFQDANRYITEKDNVIYFTNDRTLYKRTFAAEVTDNRRKTSFPSNSTTNDCPADVELVKNVDNFSIKYFDGMNNEVDPSQARSIEVALNLSANKFGKQVDANYTTRTVFRNE